MEELYWIEICEKANDNNKTIICEVARKSSRRFFKIKCNICGEEKEARISAFQGCIKCSHMKNSSYYKEEFIEKSRIMHGDKYNYDFVEYTNSKTKVKIFCNHCQRIFEQIPNGHLRGKGCNTCSIIKSTSNTQEFISKAKTVHGNKYNYDLVDYINSYTKINIFCNTCKNIFEEEPSQHLSKSECVLCNKNKRLNKEQFILQSIEIHSDKYNYDFVDFISISKKVQIKCNCCEKTFLQRPFDHIRGSGCKVCSLRNRTRSLDEFVSIATSIHGDKYNYDSVNYINKRTKINIYCNTCEQTYLQSPGQHLNRQGCKICADNRLRYDINSFIEKSQKVHNNKYNYDSAVYVDCKIKVKIFCKKCNDFFEQRPADHMHGIGCRKCAIKFVSEQQKSNTEEFILKAKQKHGDKFNYDLVQYVGVFFKVKIICNQCQFAFNQQPNNHLSGSGCPKCNESKGENRVAKYLLDKNIRFTKNKIFKTLKDKSYLKPDFYLEDLNLLIEYDGEFHYKALMGSTLEEKQKNLESQQRRDKIKNEWAKANNIPLLRIPYWDFDRIEELIEAFISKNTNKQQDTQLSLEM